MNIFDINEPAKDDLFSEVFKNIRDIKSLFYDRFVLDHYLNSSQDTTLPEADGYHKKVTLCEYVYSDPLGYLPDVYEPDLLTGSGVLFMKKIGGVVKFAFKNSVGTMEIHR